MHAKKWGERTAMQYPGLDLDAYGRTKICPVCGSDELLAGQYCHICGTLVVNECTGNCERSRKTALPETRGTVRTAEARPPFSGTGSSPNGRRRLQRILQSRLSIFQTNSRPYSEPQAPHRGAFSQTGVYAVIPPRARRKTPTDLFGRGLSPCFTGNGGTAAPRQSNDGLNA